MHCKRAATWGCLALLGCFGAYPAVPYNVKSFGASGAGHALDTAAIQRTIDAAAAAGGGGVYFPAGRFLSGTLTLKSNITLYLSPGAVLLGSARIEDYSPKHLIYAQGADNIAIEGGGAIDGQGDSFLDKSLKPLPRPSPLIEIWNCHGLRIEGITIRKAPAWTIHPKNCDGVTIRGITLLNNLRAINSDGIDIDSSRNVIISDSHIEAGDDCIVLKTTNRGAAPIQPVENVTVSNCVLVSAASALKLGTESYADFRHCLFSNCVIRDSRTGIALLVNDGPTIEDVRFENIGMTTKPKWAQSVEWPIVLDIDRRTGNRAWDESATSASLESPCTPGPRAGAGRAGQSNRGADLSGCAHADHRLREHRKGQEDERGRQVAHIGASGLRADARGHDFRPGEGPRSRWNLDRLA